MSHKGCNVKKAEQTEMHMISTRPLFEKNIFILHFSFSPFASFDVKAEKRLIQHLPCLTDRGSTPHWAHRKSLSGQLHLWKPSKPRYNSVILPHKILFSKCASWSAVFEFAAKLNWIHFTQRLWAPGAIKRAYTSSSSSCSKTESLKQI